MIEDPIRGPYLNELLSTEAMAYIAVGGFPARGAVAEMDNIKTLVIILQTGLKAVERMLNKPPEDQAELLERVLALIDGGLVPDARYTDLINARKNKETHNKDNENQKGGREGD